MGAITLNETTNIENMIREIRGKQVILDFDLATLYHVETKRINEAVRRNPQKFPERFCFKTTIEEIKTSRSQIATLNGSKRGKNIKYLSYAFTEQGVAMLATILKSPIAIQISIRIMDAFVIMHKYVANYYLEQKNIQDMIIKHDNDIKLLQESFKAFEEKRMINEIYYNGQIYDAYSKIIDILNTTKEEIIIIDGYTDKNLLDTVRRIKSNIIIITKRKSKITKLDLEKYNKQYHNLRIIYNETFHDRYFIIDRKTVYHLGASINYAGSRTFSINILQDELVKATLINNVIKIINQ